MQTGFLTEEQAVAMQQKIANIKYNPTNDNKQINNVFLIFLFFFSFAIIFPFKKYYYSLLYFYFKNKL